MPEIYRFRTLDRLLGLRSNADEEPELETQTIYFANPEQLNDPMESFRDFVWRGDAIIWINLFRHYIYCLDRMYIWCKIVGGTETWGVGDIPIFACPYAYLSDQDAALMNDIYETVLDSCQLERLANILENRAQSVRREELLFYLRHVHGVAIMQIQRLYVEHGLAPEIERSNEVVVHALPDTGLFRAMDEVTALGEDIGKFFRVCEQVLASINLTRLPAASEDDTSMFQQNIRRILFDFPGLYLKRIEELVHPNWYTAGFTRNYHSSSVWAHYADSHRGASLIFESTASEDGLESMELNQIVGVSARRGEEPHEIWRAVPMQFHDVQYVSKLREVDFFSSLSQPSISNLYKTWYCDRDGNFSDCGLHWRDDDQTDEWRDVLWGEFFRDVTIKSRDWEYEQETRLILFSHVADLSPTEKRKLTYDFSSLRGIIFGINTRDSDKLCAIKIVQEKCRQADRTDFKFYQAYYSDETGDIQRYEILNIP